MVTTATADTIADGLATRVPAELTMSIIREGVSSIVTVTEQELTDAIPLLWRTTHNMVEAAGGAAVAAAAAQREKWGGKTVAAIVSGGNLDTATLRRVFDGAR